VELLSVFIVNAVKESVDRDVEAFGIVHQFREALEFFRIDLGGSVPPVWIMGDADLAAQKVILVPIAKAKRGNDPLPDAFSEQVNGLVVLQGMIAGHARAGGLTEQAKISALIPGNIVKTNLQSDRNANSFHGAFLPFYHIVFSIARREEKVKP
jgi:hypothetical protein